MCIEHDTPSPKNTPEYGTGWIRARFMTIKLLHFLNHETCFNGGEGDEDGDGDESDSSTTCNTNTPGGV